VVLDEPKLHRRTLTIAELEEEGHHIVRTAPVTAATQEPPLGESPPHAAPLGQDLIKNGGLKHR
jgi:hypothetical protein